MYGILYTPDMAEIGPHLYLYKDSLSITYPLNVGIPLNQTLLIQLVTILITQNHRILCKQMTIVKYEWLLKTIELFWDHKNIKLILFLNTHFLAMYSFIYLLTSN